MWMWSDTASEMKNGRGDIVTHNPDAWNFADGVSTRVVRQIDFIVKNVFYKNDTTYEI